jgi:hypothetical protein
MRIFLQLITDFCLILGLVTKNFRLGYVEDLCLLFSVVKIDLLAFPFLVVVQWDILFFLGTVDQSHLRWWSSLLFVEKWAERLRNGKYTA